MDKAEFLNQFNLKYNNITSNQAPGLNILEISMFLTMAQEEILKNHLLPQSDQKQAGYDGTIKRQIDFSGLMRTANLTPVDTEDSTSDPPEKVYTLFSDKSLFYEMPLDLFSIVNEAIRLTHVTAGRQGRPVTKIKTRQVKALSYAEYTRLMQKGQKGPLKNQAWRLITNSTNLSEDSENAYWGNNGIGAEVILTPNDRAWLKDTAEGTKSIEYIMRYIRRPMPIIVDDLSSLGANLTIEGQDGTEDFYADKCCELNPILHSEIIQRAVELAKEAWQGDLQSAVQLGQRTE